MKFEEIKLFENSTFFKIFNTETQQEEIIIIGELYGDLCITTIPEITKEITIEQYNKILSTYRTVFLINTNRQYVIDKNSLTHFDYVISLSEEFRFVILSDLEEIIKPISNKVRLDKVTQFFIEDKNDEYLNTFENKFVWDVDAAITEQLIVSMLRKNYSSSLNKWDIVINIRKIIKAELERIVKELSKEEERK